MERSGPARHGMARRGGPRLGPVRHGPVRHVRARHRLEHLAVKREHARRARQHGDPQPLGAEVQVALATEPWGQRRWPTGSRTMLLCV